MAFKAINDKAFTEHNMSAAERANHVFDGMGDAPVRRGGFYLNTNTARAV